MSVYSDNGEKLSVTFWIYRRLEVDNATAIAFANTVTGMAMLCRSSLLSTALPFPGLPGIAYHDRWLTLAALAKGKLAYVAKPLVRYIQHGGNHTGVFKRPPTAAALILQFAKCFAFSALAVLHPPLRGTLPKRLEHCARWTSIELLSLSLQIETLQQRLPREQWRSDTWDQFETLAMHPSSAIFQLSLKSLSDPYRRQLLVGLALGSLFRSLVSFALRCAARLKKPSSSGRPKV
jgi:hypothetical protein